VATIPGAEKKIEKKFASAEYSPAVPSPDKAASAKSPAQLYLRRNPEKLLLL